MKKQLLMIMFLGLLIGATASAGQICGTLSMANTCGSRQGCTKFFLRDNEREEGSNPYLVEPNNSQIKAELIRLANGTSEVCVQGSVGANNDPDLLLASGAKAKAKERTVYLKHCPDPLPAVAACTFLRIGMACSWTQGSTTYVCRNYD